MNYRHAFHAGNFADVLKHAVLARVLAYMTGKPAPLRYIDTHAGIGWYDLDSDEAVRTGEWRNGIGRLDGTAVPPELQPILQPYLDAVGPRDPSGMPIHYPGSPAIAQRLLRRTDKLLLCERHPADQAALRVAMKGDKRVKILPHDGYRALNAVVPPPERRGVVLIDPPFESKTEFDDLTSAVASAFRKWPTGTYLIWYPIKDTAAVAGFRRQMLALGLSAWIDLVLRQDGDTDAGGLRACGLFAINPPYTLQAEADRLISYLAQCFSMAGHSTWTGTVSGRID